ncbi:MAG: Calx-beta domain-containing protein [Pyrinomonadaceae bacterium]
MRPSSTLATAVVSLFILGAAAFPARSAQTVVPAGNGKLAFASDRDGNYEIYTVNPDGTSPARLTNHQAEDYDPAWSPDGARIAFVSDRDGSSEIYVMNADGGGQQTRLTNNQAGDFDPAWSPDGTKIAFTSDRDGNEEIYVMSATGGGQTNLTGNGADDNFPAWSPDGTKLAFTSDRDADFEIYVMAASGAAQTNASRNDADDSFPAWSPDGAKLAFASDRNGRYELHLMNPDGGGQASLGGSPAREETSPVWSPDGTKLAFMAGDFVGGQIVNNDILTMSAAAGGARTNLPNNSADDIYPDWQRLAAAPVGASVQFGSAAYNFGEGAGRALVTVTRTGDTSGAVTVGYSTVDDPAAVRCDAATGTAYARCDYATTVDTLTFAAGETQKTFAVPLVDDAHIEGNETLQLRLSGPTGATLGAQSTATLTLADNDAAGAANPVDAHQFFVRQQYLDFLSREPEDAGFQSWLGVLNGCTNPFNTDPNSASAGCDRNNVSSSFFRSDEFQLKGLYVYLFYRVALNRRPEYAEIVSDMRAVTGATTAELNQKRAQFALTFIQRQEFRGLFDARSNNDFVGALLAPLGVTSITTADPASPDAGGQVTLTRADLTAALDNNTLSQARVLRAVVQSREVLARESNGAFVAMQYYGYLRRTPENEGYNAWLNYLNQNPTDFRTMVHGFLNSVEYRLRFGRL